MSSYLLVAVDLALIAVLTLGVYYPRHHRTDLVTAFVAVNVGVLAVTIVLHDSAATIGLGLGLFGVLSIIRLRSNELGQHEIGYYFSALALGLIGGLGRADVVLSVVLMVGVVVALAVVDSRRMTRRSSQQLVVLDVAVTEERELVDRLEALLGRRVVGVTPVRVDLVNDTTTVSVRSLAGPVEAAGAAASDDVHSRPLAGAR